MFSPRFLGTVALSVAVTAACGVVTASAQGTGVPSSSPPPGFAGSQFVDSSGCAFLRSGMAGATQWVPRVTRGNVPLCNFEPTVSPATVPVGDGVPAEGPPPGYTGTQFVDSDGCPFVRTDVPGDSNWMPRVDGTRRQVCTYPPTVNGAGNWSPDRTVAIPAPARPRSAPAVAAPVAAPAPRALPSGQITLEQACAGRTGIQPGLISASTGQPVDCGGVPAGIGAAPVTLTLEQACARQQTTGERLIDATTDQPILCLSGDLPQADAYLAAAPVAASPVYAATPVQAPPGYEPVWDDGRINPLRGLPRSNVSTRTTEAVLLP